MLPYDFFKFWRLLFIHIFYQLIPPFKRWRSIVRLIVKIKFTSSIKINQFFYSIMIYYQVIFNLSAIIVSKVTTPRFKGFSYYPWYFNPLFSLFFFEFPYRQALLWEMPKGCASKSCHGRNREIRWWIRINISRVYN